MITCPVCGLVHETLESLKEDVAAHTDVEKMAVLAVHMPDVAEKLEELSDE